MRAVDDDADTKVEFVFEGLDGMTIVPEVLPLKYGCGGAPYETCVSDPSKQNDGTTDLYWDLTSLSDFTCTPASMNDSHVPSPIRCGGEADIQTCGTPAPGGATACSKGEPPPPAKVCFFARELVPPSVDQALWKRFYADEPGAQTCKTCFMLKVSDRPFFVTPQTKLPGTNLEATVGQELVIDLMASASVRGVVDIAIIANPGAPMHAFMTPTEKVEYAEVFHQTAYRRRFRWTPVVGQHGVTIGVCFQATTIVVQDGASLPQRSDIWCYNIHVLDIVVSWKGSAPCPAIAHLQSEFPSRLSLLLIP